MNEHDQARFESELRRAAPAFVPDHFMTRLRAARPDKERGRTLHWRPAPEWLRWWNIPRWLMPTATVAVAAFWLMSEKLKVATAHKPPLAAAAGLKADAVRVDEELVSSFDVVATLPGGEPVRFRCRQWKDQLVVTDKTRGVEIEENRPRVEVTPVRFETY